MIKHVRPLLLIVLFSACLNTMAQTTPQEIKTDALALRIIRLFNNKQADSVYLYAADDFKKIINAEKWKSISETSVYPLTPFSYPVFLNSKNGVSTYRLNNQNFLIGLNDEGKFSTLFLIPLRKGETPTDNPLKTHLDSLVHKILADYMQLADNVAVSAGVFYKGKNYFYNYGETKLNNKQLPAGKTLYEIGSITKTYTATLLAMAVIGKKVTLDMPAVKFLPDSVAVNPALKNITLKQLSNHTSGLPRMPDDFDSYQTDPNQPYENYGTPQLFAFLKRFKATRQPGTTYEYSNLAVGLLGIILEKIYQQPYEQLLEKYITKPKNFKYTKINIRPQDTSLVAQGYAANNQSVPLWKLNAFKAAGALKSNTYEQLQYGKLQISSPDEALNKAINLTHQITFKDKNTTVGLGWHYWLDDQVLVHQGGTGGYLTGLCIDNNKRIVVSVLTNNVTTGGPLAPLIIKALEEEK
jgi:CubicO group peptidase (beta-lactamase class C family)